MNLRRKTGSAFAKDLAARFRLTATERVLLRYLRRGCDNATIAVATGRRPGTVRNQCTILLQKVGIRTRARLVARLNGGGPLVAFPLPPTPTKASKTMSAVRSPARRRLASAKKKRSEPLVNPWPALSDAEHLIAVELIKGFSNKEISVRVGKREATVKNQMRSMFRRTGYSTRTKLLVALLAHSTPTAVQRARPGENREDFRIEVDARSATSDPAEMGGCAEGRAATGGR
jgi:DNA-binding NarL/FixJ family response regulator